MHGEQLRPAAVLLLLSTNWLFGVTARRAFTCAAVSSTGGERRTARGERPTAASHRPSLESLERGGGGSIAQRAAIPVEGSIASEHQQSLVLCRCQAKLLNSVPVNLVNGNRHLVEANVRLSGGRQAGSASRHRRQGAAGRWTLMSRPLLCVELGRRRPSVPLGVPLSPEGARCLAKCSRVLCQPWSQSRRESQRVSRMQ